MKLLAKQSKRISIFLISVMVGQIISPLSAFALTGGPSQPEVQSFAPVSSSDMVDLFTGDFNYNIPLLDVDGYPLNLAYSGGISMDQEASWVGLGWNLNPGVINRTMRGLPDDFNGDEVKSQLSMRDNATYSVGVGLKPEFFGFKIGENLKVSTKVSLGLHHNNYRGLGFDFGVDPSIGYNSGGGSLGAGLGLNFSSSDGFSADIYTNAGVHENVQDGELGHGLGANASLGYNSRSGLKSLNTGINFSATKSYENNFYQGGTSFQLLGSNQTFGTQTHTPNISAASTSAGASFSYGWGPEFVGANGKMSVNASANITHYYDDVVSKKSYGYLFLDKKSTNDVLLDFNREKDVPFIESSPNLPIPMGTYDMFSVSAQGMGGTFRTYRNDFPMFHDDEKHQNYAKNGDKAKLIETALGVEYGGTQTLKLGINATMIFNKSYSGMWVTNNDLLYKINMAADGYDKDKTFEAGYFKMLGEFSPLKTSTLDSVGGKNLTSPVTGQSSVTKFLKEYNSKLELNTNIKNNSLSSGLISLRGREKRNKLITYINAQEAYNLNYDWAIPVLSVNATNESEKAMPITLLRKTAKRKAHHISIITVTGEDGQRFVYGIPAYNSKSVEKSFSVGTPTVQASGQITYDTLDNTIYNSKGVDYYYSSKETPPYSHSFLLTGVLSPDYVDKTNNGITDDDYGTAIKFGYRMPNDTFKWRVPFKFRSANYQEGNKSSALDNKASYLYGVKEIWHLRTVEGKNHIAVFELQKRNDGFGVKGDDGGLDTNMTSYMLKKITLYAKNDYQLNGSNAYPIKTVHFTYDYTLCKNVENNNGDTVIVNGTNINFNKGKLTLKSLYFTYGRSNKGRLSPYVFNYSDVNPSYDLKGSDRWGYYKPNRGTYGLTGSPNNAEYPYTIQNKDSADMYCSAWCLTEIVLPSGGKIQVTYESDDYAYVQDKKAMHMCQLEGFSQEFTGDKSDDSYLFDPDDPKNPMKYAYFKLDEQITGGSKNDVFREQYLKDLKTIQFDMLARVSSYDDDDYEFVKVYAEVDISKSGVTDDGFSGYLYLEPKAILTRKEDNDAKKVVNPLAKGIWQFIRNQVPYQIHPMSDRNRQYDEGHNRNVLTGMATAFSKAANIVTGGIEKYMFRKGYGSDINLNKSWVRVNDPDGKKYGGGQRVKRITMNDDWASMSHDKGDENQTYGQEYVYESRDTITHQTISSGVAAYEPIIGGDENPFKNPVSTIEEIKWAPDMIHTTDEPIGESYSPAPVVGYSKVKIIPLIPNGIIKQQTGCTVNTFYTAKDYPFKVTASPIDVSKIKPVFGAFLDKKVYQTTASQGYLIETNDMHGKPRGQMIYTSKGKLVSGSETIYAFDTNDPNKLDNKVKTIKNDGTIGNAELGVSVDLFSDVRESNSNTLTATGQFNTDVFTIAIAVIPILTLFIFPKKEDRIFQSAVIVKHVNRIGLVKKTIAYQEGASIVTSNLLYDHETGQVLLTSVQNEFHEDIYNFTYPAHWAYDKGMGQGYKNSNLILYDVVFDHDTTYIPKLSGKNLNNYLVPGDECILTIQGVERSELVHAYLGKDKIIKLMDVNGHVIYDEFGIHYMLKVIRSGRRNMQSTPIGSVTTLLNPASGSSLQFDSILNSSASEYSEKWKVFCNEITDLKLDCDTPSDITGALNLMLFAQRTSGGGSYFWNSADTSSYSVGQFKSAVTPHQIYDSSSIMREFFDDSCRSEHNDNETFNDTLTTSHGIYNHEVSYYSYVSQAKKDEYRALYNSSGDTAWRASLGNRFLLTYIAFTQYCFCPEPPGLDFWLYSNDVIPFKDIVYFKDISPYTTALLEGSPNLAYQFKIVAVMADDSEVEMKGYGLCPIFKLNCTQYCEERPYAMQINPYTYGIKGNWRKVKDYAFSGDRKYSSSKASPKRDGQYNGGGQYTNFWKKGSISEATGSYYSADLSNNKWVWTNEVTIYSPYGPELENRNALNIYSSAIYGFRHTLPMAVASNAKYRQIGYESFEDESSLKDCGKGHFSFMINLGSNAGIDKTTKHSGKTSLKVKKDTAQILEIQWPDTTAESFVKEDTNKYMKSKTDCIGTFLPDSGYYVLGAWVRDSVSALDTTFSNPEITIEVVKGGVTTTYHLKSSGLIIHGWQRVEGRFKIPIGTTLIRFKLKSAEGHCSWFDDIRVHPVAGNMKSYAYDPITLRLMADLDENNYASFYEYDLEGNLARLKRETEKGILTIKETKSSIKGAK